MEESKSISLNLKDIIAVLKNNSDSPHPSRYVFALVRFLKEIGELMDRWEVLTFEDGRTNITLPKYLEDAYTKISS